MSEEVKPVATGTPAPAVEVTPAPIVPDPAVKEPVVADIAPDAPLEVPPVKPEDKPVVPEKYDLKLPEGSQLPPAHVEKLASLAKERGLSQDEAQAMLDRDSGLISSYAKEQQDQFKKQSDTWKAEFVADKEFGGEKATENVELAHRVVKRFADDKFVQELERSGLGDHPDLLRTFARIGKEMSEDRLRMPNTQGGGGVKKSAEETFYPNNV